MPAPKRQEIQVNVSTTNYNIVVEIEPQMKIKLNIFDAIKAKDFDSIFLYLKAGGDINVKNNHDETPLLLAIKEGWNANEVKKFLDQTDSVDLTQRIGKPIYAGQMNVGNAMEMAVKHNDPNLLKVLAEYNGGIKFGTDILFDYSQSYSATWGVLAENLDYSTLKNFKYGSTFQQFPEAGVLYNAMFSTDKEFKVVFDHFKEYDVSQAARQIGLQLMCMKYGDDSKEVTNLIEQKYFTDFSGYLLSSHFHATYENCKNFKEYGYLRFYLDHINDIDGFISDFKKLNDQKKFNDGSTFLDFLYEIRHEKMGLPMPVDDSGTIYINDVIDTSGNNIKLPNNNESMHVDINICNNNGMCILVKVDAAQLPALQHIDGIVVA